MYSEWVLETVITWLKSLCKDARYSSELLPRRIARAVRSNGIVCTLEEAAVTLRKIAEALTDIAGEYAAHRRQRAWNLLMAVESAISRQSKPTSHSGKQV